MLDAASWAGRLGGETFLAQTYHRSYAHLPGATDTTNLFSWDDLNRIIATQRLEPPRLRLSADGEMVPLHRYAVPVTNRRAVTWSRILPAELHTQLKDGASLVLDAAEKIHPRVGAAAEGLERFLGTSVQANVYASWTGREGFGLHWDDHDVVVVQLHGSKRWRLPNEPATNPTGQRCTEDCEKRSRSWKSWCSGAGSVATASPDGPASPREPFTFRSW